MSRGIPNKCLPLDFMGFYALSALEDDKRIRNISKQCMLTDINKRREYIKGISIISSELTFFLLNNLICFIKI